MTYSAEVLADSPLLYWRLGEASGTSASDSSGNSRSGTYAGSPTLGATGALSGDSDTGVEFDGVDDQVSIGDAAWNHPTRLTVEAWAKADVATPATTKYIASKTNLGSLGTLNYQFQLYQSTAGDLGAVVMISTATQVTVTAPGIFTDLAYHHCAVTFDGSAVRLYADGILVAAGALSGNLAAGNNAALVIGNNDSATSRHWDGKIDEVAYYGVALSPSRIAAHYKAGAGVAAAVSDYELAVLDDSPAYFYLLDETSGTTANDRAKYGRNATYSGATLNQPPLMNSGRSILLGGDGDSLSRATETPMSFVRATIEAWVRIDGAAGGGGGWHTVVAKDNYLGSFSSRAWTLAVESGTNIVQWSAFYNSTTRWDLRSPTGLTTGRVYHLVGTYDSVNAKLYIDGIEVASVAQTANMRTSTYPLTLGKDSGGKYMNGGLDAVSLYSYGLSAARVLAHFQAGSPPVLNMTSETDLAQPFTVNRGFPLSAPVESDSAQAITLALPAGRVDESEVAQDFIMHRGVPLETALESDRAPQLGAVDQVQPLDQASEVSSTTGMSTTLGLGRASEVSSGTGMSTALDLGQASETDAARILTIQSTVVATLALSGAGTLAITTEAIWFASDVDFQILDNDLRRAPTSFTFVLTGYEPRTRVELRMSIPNSRVEDRFTLLDPATGAPYDEVPVGWAVELFDRLLWVGETNASGEISPTSVAVPLIDAGTWEVRAYGPVIGGVDDGDIVEIGSDTFELLLDAQVADVIPGADAHSVEVPGAVGVDGVTRRWVFQDLTPELSGGLGSWIMPINPATMTSPHLEHAMSSRHTTSPNGQFHVWQAGAVPHEWTFGGICISKEMQEKLTAFRNLNRRFYIIDHRNRAWKVIISHLEIVPRLRTNFNGEVSDWVGDYTMTATILDQNPQTPE